MPDIFLKIPEPALRRLPWYLAYAQLAKRQGVKFLSSTQIAKKIGIEASLVAKDFSYVTISGKTRVGYDVDELIFALNHFLGFANQHEAFLFGVGSLGSSLLHDHGLLQYGLKILAAFDVKHELVGTQINRIPIHHVNHFMSLQKQMNVHIGVLTVPVDNAQEVADVMIAGGIRAIWNFTPFRIRVPENIVVQNTSMYAHLALIFNRLKEELETEKHEDV